jgi:hypothetical protein
MNSGSSDKYRSYGEVNDFGEGSNDIRLADTKLLPNIRLSLMDDEADTELTDQGIDIFSNKKYD